MPRTAPRALLLGALVPLGALALPPLAAPALAQAAGPACTDAPLSNDEAARISFPVVTIKSGQSVNAMPKGTKDALNAPLRAAGALGEVGPVVVYKNLRQGDTPTATDVARVYGSTLSRAEGWKPVLAGAGDGLLALGEERFVGVYSDDKADVVVRIEPAPGFPRADLPGGPDDLARLRKWASEGEVVVYRYEGKGIARAVCAGKLPSVVPAPGAPAAPRA